MLRDDEDTAGIRIHLENEAFHEKLFAKALSRVAEIEAVRDWVDPFEFADRKPDWDPERGCYVFQVRGEIAVWPEEVE